MTSCAGPVENSVKTNLPNPYFQVGLDVFDKVCLVGGGGSEAVEKTDRLLRAGGRLRLVSPAVDSQLKLRVTENRIDYRAREFCAADLEGVFLVLNTVGHDPSLAEEIFELTRQRKILLNTYDQPQLSDLGMAALVDPGHLRLSISTSNASPALARRLRQDLEPLFDAEFVEYLERLAELRRHLKASEPEVAKRRAQLRSAVEGFRFHGELRYPPDWRQRLAELLTDVPIN